MALVVTTVVVIATANVVLLARGVAWIDQSWMSWWWVVGSAFASCGAVLLARRAPATAGMVGLLPFAWVVAHRQWIVWWEVALLTVVVVAATSSWRRALAPAAAMAVALVIIVPRDTQLFVVGPSWHFQPGLADGGAEWPLEDASNLFAQSSLLLAAVLLPAALGVVRRADVSSLRLRRQGAALEAQAATQAERARLASDLHDVVAHHVSLIAVRAETAPYVEPGVDSRTRTVLADIADDARRALGELRGVLGVLQRADDSPALAPQPSLRDLPDLVLRATTAGDRIIADGIDAPWVVPDTVGYVVYRVVQEGLTNARRHARGGDVELRLDLDGDDLVVGIVNLPGKASTDPAGEPGQGLVSMTERVQAMGGVVVAGPTGGGGFAVTARVPVTVHR